MTAETKEKQQATTSDVVEHFWPEHLSGQEVKTKWPRGRNATITQVAIEEVFDNQINAKKRMVVIYFEGIARGLVTNKTNGRWVAKQLGGDDHLWLGQSVSLMAAQRSNGSMGVDLGEPFED